jgi:hypothetical protein
MRMYGGSGARMSSGEHNDLDRWSLLKDVDRDSAAELAQAPADEAMEFWLAYARQEAAFLNADGDHAAECIHQRDVARLAGHVSRFASQRAAARAAALRPMG